jgi:hypothetical protein
MVRIGALALSLSLLACTQTPGPSHPVVGVAPDGTPKWVNRGSGAFDGEHGKCFYGVGVLQGVRNPALARQAADNRARGEIAKLFDLYVAAMMKDYQRSTTAGNFKASAEEQDIVSTQKTITEVTLRGVEIRDHWTDPQTGTLYALAILDVDGISKSLGDARQLAAPIRDFVRANARRAFADMDRDLQLRRADHPKLPTCDGSAKLTYLVDTSAQIYTFDPSLASPITPKGKLSCPISGGPFSMAVRHDGTAFVLFSVGSRACTGLGRVVLKTLACEKVSGFSCATDAGLFGMGYALSTSGEETLYISGRDTRRFGTLDPESGKVTLIGTLPVGGIEPAGNPKGELWGFTPTPSATVLRFNSATGAGVQTFPLAIPVTRSGYQAWAFTENARYFYVFYGERGQPGSGVYRLASDGTLTTFLANTGIQFITGSGSSVCAGL